MSLTALFLKSRALFAVDQSAYFIRARVFSPVVDIDKMLT
jgi:hypothetical protein